MNIQIKTHGTSLTPAITEYINKRVSSLAKFAGGYRNDQDVSKNVSRDASTEAVAYVQISRTSNHHKAGDDLFATEINLDAGSTHLRAESFDADLYASIDKVRDEMMRELTSVKGKRVSALRRGGERLKNMLRGLGGRGRK